MMVLTLLALIAIDLPLALCEAFAGGALTWPSVLEAARMWAVRGWVAAICVGRMSCATVVELSRRRNC